jgi:AbrB family looped-hinge helix DNA binding protein
MSHMVEIDVNGRILIPAKLRNKLNLHKGDKLALIEQGDTLTLVKKLDRLKEAQQLFQTLFREGKAGSVEDFLAFRKEEARLEQHQMEE